MNLRIDVKEQLIIDGYSAVLLSPISMNHGYLALELCCSKFICVLFQVHSEFQYHKKEIQEHISKILISHMQKKWI